MMRRGGFTLIFALGILSMLALFAGTLVAMTRVEQAAASNYLARQDTERALTAAMETAILALRSEARRAPHSATDRSSGVFNGRWLYRDATGHLPGHSLKLEAADKLDKAGKSMCPNPSFRVDVADAALFPDVPWLSDTKKPFTCSGILGRDETGAPRVAYYKVLDTHSQINVNGQQPTLPFMLYMLGKAIQKDKGLAKNPIDRALADAVVAERDKLPLRRYTSKTQLREVFGKDLSLVEDYLSVRGWFPSNTFFNRSQTVGGDPTKVDLSGLGFYPRQVDLIAERRYPVNINTAPRPVLTAILAGLQGHQMLKERASGTALRGGQPLLTDRDPNALIGGSKGGKLDFDKAWGLAGAIIYRRHIAEPGISALPRSFSGWEDFRGFMRSLPKENRSVLDPFKLDYDTSSLTAEDLDLVITALSPHYIAADTQPNDGLSLNLDKAHVMWEETVEGTPILAPGGTTEICFSPMGYLEVECLLQTRGAKSGRVESQTRARRIVKYLDVYRHATQRDFEVAARDPSGSPRTTFNDGFNNAVLDFGSTTAAAHRYAKTYPTNVRAQGWQQADPFGGYVLLGTDEEVVSRTSMGQTFCAQFEKPVNNDLKADFPASGAARDTIATTSRKLDVGPSAGGDLLPDGLYGIQVRAEGDQRQLTYSSSGNVNPQIGGCEFWVKLHAAPSLGTNEVLLYVSGTLPNMGGDQTGWSWRLERYGSSLVSTRFFWGSPGKRAPDPDGNSNNNTGQYTWTEARFNIGGWRAGEWHMVGLRWSEWVNQNICVDGVKNAMGATQPRRTTTTSASTWYQAGTTTNTEWPFRLVSNRPANLIQVGGYTHTTTTLAADARLYDKDSGEDIPIPRNRAVHRYCNATIDNLRFYNQETTSGSPSSPPKRYPIAATPPSVLGNDGDFAEYRGQFRFDPGLVVGLSWDVRLPTAYGGTTLNPEDYRLDVQFRPEKMGTLVTTTTLAEVNQGFTSLRGTKGLSPSAAWRIRPLPPSTDPDPDPEFHNGRWAIGNLPGNKATDRFSYAIKLFQKPHDNVAPALALVEILVEGRPQEFSY